ncbi:AEC family transporter [Aquifex aeolicus]|uniref:Transporter n=1 Tax=Aquifex aeolicus (strain VF5) TaxID=224324 RepID=O67397_AQUAE|nr:AEC family transporter [Aquifex aeolicus]AAC07368.1 hypothetical protein aq_1392 [Aquifex aeolicus VF5]
MFIYEKVFFILLIIAFAYTLKRGGIFKEEHALPFINYVIYFALPFTIFKNLRFLEIGKEVLGVVLIAWGAIFLSILFAFLFGKFLKLEEKTLRAFLLVSSFGNTAFMGYPFLYALEGNEGLKYAILYDQLGSFLMVITLGLFLAIGKFDLKELILFPPFIALVLSFLLHGVRFPQFFEHSVEIISGSLIPVILFSLGLRLNFTDMKSDYRTLFSALFIKMFLVPLLILVFLKIFGLTSLPYRVALIESAMPPMVFAGVLALKYELDFRLAFSAITLGIVISLFTVPVFRILL